MARWHARVFLITDHRSPITDHRLLITDYRPRSVANVAMATAVLAL
ncbi:MAG TPA: hypothetical protein VN957_12020 [Chthoniobacterales bacterium]|nr:hypothetical protein [Chthoniobacterales bacterium]